MENHPDQILPLSTNKSVILDIDEDFFGCAKGSDTLMATGLNWTHVGKNLTAYSIPFSLFQKSSRLIAVCVTFCCCFHISHTYYNFFTVEVINEVMKQLFCISTVKEERLLASSLTTLLQSDCDSPLSPDCVSTQRSDIAVIQRSRCTDVEDIAEAFMSMKSYIKNNLNTPQFDELIRSGFCLHTSPKTADISIFKEPNHLVVCIGVNGPESENSVFFTPDEQRVKRDLKSVRKIMGQVATDNIGLVTIARSNRDGYVPRKFQPAIEDGLLKILKDEVDAKIETIYDDNLFVKSIK